MSDERTWLLAPGVSINASLPEAASAHSHQPNLPSSSIQRSSPRCSAARARSQSMRTSGGRLSDANAPGDCRRRSSGAGCESGFASGRCRATANCRPRATLVRWRRDGPRAWLVCFAVFCAYSVCTEGLFRPTHEY